VSNGAPNAMIGTLILTQGELAKELLRAAGTIAGPLPATEAIGLDWQDTFEESTEKVRAAILRLDAGQGVLVLTDMFGSTPTNVALRFAQTGRVEVVTGVNLPMLLRLGCTAHPPGTLLELARWIQAKGQRSIALGSEGPPNRKSSPQEPRCADSAVAMAEKADG
jgi:PTS system mannose-specific IIA component